MIKDFRDLEIYQLANDLTLDVYEVIKDLPRSERYVLIDQLRRATTSIGANIAEGFGRYHTKEYIKFLYISRGSLMEVWHFLILAQKLGYVKEISSFETKINKLAVKINNLIRAISSKKQQ
ncbi:MAG: four helix bundle protein [Patescibacteria group bacterium]|nr:four helix bundle protein [Patescibacteria group bacterium]